MQTFLPYPDFTESAKALDSKRLGKQRVEGLQLLKILNGIFGKRKGWANHPATKMWRGHRGCLKQYTQAMINEWIARGYKNTIDLACFADDENTPPAWLGSHDFHQAHRSNLMRKQLESQAKQVMLDRDYQAMWYETPVNLPYVWPDSFSHTL